MTLRTMAFHVWRRADSRVRLLLDVEDLMQEAHLLLLRRPDASRSRQWGHLLDVARRARNITPPAHSRFIEPALVEPEDHSDLYAAIGQLEPRLQLIIVLRYWYSWRLAQIADIWGFSEARASQLCARALEQLRSNLYARREAA